MNRPRDTTPTIKPQVEVVLAVQVRQLGRPPPTSAMPAATQALAMPVTISAATSARTARAM